MPTFDTEVVLDLPAKRLWKALKDGNTLFPKIAPQVFASVDHVDGVEGEPGAVRRINFGPAAPAGSFVTEKFDSINYGEMTVSSFEVEGGHLREGFTSWESTMKLIPVGEDKVKVHFTFDYEGPGPVDASIAQAEEGSPQLFKALEAYLLSNQEYL
ncbi:hypothetical protein MPTK1_6g04130 [Marchantia polymorpha subsp. ruderalis]|uniref:Bet v I/Major latex protein domain-containing protein n=2 Tax=Marchantia polymorpha TaxID=3197 RepID=A0A176WS92_MARPO|nr:hypothetical protein AXG93_93s1360 [Marchantia polymorpha subsp. ruderalis]PTQ41525.1 hypothetical protein MARPO_0034s0105 [Marchantia polymorpha]BBN13514.1 hypothetical protein Mp_6g04130 [Marchantia polymorpha subsp. ruderalis]|eukprot:PTQ41525.1 hypothetical protein MARPO_0034s0105 [Marchantia polymorpha]